MSMKPWGGMDPNSAHQLWSAWTFIAYEGSKRQRMNEMTYNVLKWLRVRFGSTGRARINREIIRDHEQVTIKWVVTCQIEGAPANDPEFVQNIRTLWEKQFVRPGFGFGAIAQMHVEILAGDAQDGKPAAQLVVLPDHEMPKELVTKTLIH